MGSIYKQKGSKKYWIKYYQNGQEYRESSKSEKKKDAIALLKEREGDVVKGLHPGRAILTTTINELADFYLNDYRANSRKSIRVALGYAKLIKKHFGKMLAVNLTTQHTMKYRTIRKSEGVVDSTVNRELAALHRMFNLGMRHTPPLVARIPYMAKVSEHNVRTGFYERDAFLAVRGALPDHLKVAVSITFYWGLRLGEILNLRWENIEWQAKVIRLDPGTTKNDEGRYAPLIRDLYNVLWAWRLKTLEKYPHCPWVVHYRGKHITDIRAGWNAACKKVGLVGKHFHDFRRTAIRNMDRAGIPRSVGKTISGHKTDSIYNRYNITSARDIEESGVKLEKFFEEQIFDRHSLGIVEEKTEEMREAEIS